MAAFFREVLDDFLTPEFLEGVRKKYHFEQDGFMELHTAAKNMLPWMRREAFWDRKKYQMQEPLRPDACRKEANPIYECVVMTLGYGIDQLQESCNDRGGLLKSYMMEALASEILLKSYHAYEQFLRKKTGWHIARYHFPGYEEAFPLELLPDLLRAYAPRITCNSAFCMSPSKSVVFLSELTQEGRHGGSICLGCTNNHCPYRVTDVTSGKRQAQEKQDLPLTYGYSTIFGASSPILRNRN